MGRVVYSDVPHRPDPSRWIHPALLASNAALAAACKYIAPRTNVVFREPFLVAAESDRPIVYVTWHRLNYVCMPMLLSLPAEARPTIIAHDGAASRAFSHQSVAWMGMEAFAFRRRSKVSAREQIVNYIRTTRRPILNLPDSGGPYGRVKPGILEVARACDARIVPFVVESDRALSVGKTLNHVIPLPHARVDVRRGPPLEGTASVAELQSALDALG